MNPRLKRINLETFHRKYRDAFTGELGGKLINRTPFYKIDDNRELVIINFTPDGDFFVELAVPFSKIFSMHTPEEVATFTHNDYSSDPHIERFLKETVGLRGVLFE